MCVTWTLALAGSVSVLAGAAYAYAATRFSDRGAGRDRAGARAFAVWWSAIAVYTGAQGIEDIMGAAGVTPIAVFLAWRFVSLAVYCVGLGGLAAYVLYVRTGSSRWPRVAMLYYGILSVPLIALAASGRPTGVSIQTWRTDVAYSTPTAGPMVLAVMALLILPIIVAIAAYLRLRASADSTQARARILIVGWSMATWLVATALSRASENDALQLVARPILGSMVALAVVYAFRGPVAPQRVASREALQQRVRDLV